MWSSSVSRRPRRWLMSHKRSRRRLISSSGCIRTGRVSSAAEAMPRQQQVSRWYRLRNSELFVGMLFISPWIVGFGWFWLYPIASSVYYSFTSYNMMLPPIPVGLDNYRNLFQDDLFWLSLKNTAVYSLVSVPIDLAFAFVLALLLNQKLMGRAFFRAVFYFPTVVPSVATAILWTLLLATQGGLVNAAIGIFGVGGLPWLSSPSWAMPSLIFLSLWTVGPAVVIFLAGLQDVPESLYEAARIDGASYLRLVRHITIPMMSPVILFNLIIGLIGAFRSSPPRSSCSTAAARSTRCSCTRSSSTRWPLNTSRWAMPRQWPG